jgi:hypothetical protein
MQRHLCRSNNIKFILIIYWGEGGGIDIISRAGGGRVVVNFTPKPKPLVKGNMCSEEAGAQEQAEPRREAGRRHSPLSGHRGRPLGLPGQAEHTR